MSLNDVAILIIAIADLILRVWEMRRGRRGNDDPNQFGTLFRIRQLGRDWHPGSTSLIKAQKVFTQSYLLTNP